MKLAKFYGVSVDYILCLTDNRNPQNTELTELHLSDDMAELLKSGRINNRLLCEKVLFEYQPIEEDTDLKALEAMQIWEEDYFCQVTHRTWDAILHAIREAHSSEKCYEENSGI